jgi:hypothetical protein
LIGAVEAIFPGTGGAEGTVVGTLGGLAIDFCRVCKAGCCAARERRDSAVWKVEAIYRDGTLAGIEYVSLSCSQNCLLRNQNNNRAQLYS